MDTEHEAAVATQMRANAITFVEGHPIAIVPTETKLIDLEPYIGRPLIKRAQVAVQDSDSFIRYINEHKQDHTRIFASVDANGATFNAILDYHEAEGGKADKGAHRVGYALKHSVEWLRWKQGDKQKFTQKDFAKFIEDNLVDFVSPPGAEMLDIATTLEATTSVNFKKGIRLQNGNESLLYSETTEAKAGAAGELEIPKEIRIIIPVFDRQEPTLVTLRLRYRIDDGALSFSYEIIAPHKIIETMIAAMIDRIRTGTEIDPFRGSVSMS